MRLYKIVVAVLFLTSAVSTESKNDADGEVAEEGQFPFMVSVQYNETHYCSGSIIDLDKILTSASCVQEIAEKQKETLKQILDTGKLRVVAGTTFWSTADNSTDSEEIQNIMVNDIDLTNQYNTSIAKSDIAMLFLNGTLNATDDVQKIALPPSDAVLSQILKEDRLVATFAGWGHNKATNFGHLSYNYLETLPDCEFSANKKYNVSADQFCAIWVEDGVESHGSRGGPLFIRLSTNYTQIGILSYTKRKVFKKSEKILVFTEVAKHLDWIEGSSAAPNHMNILVHIFTFVSAYFLM